MNEIPEFGKPWAEAGETRPRRFVTPLAWVEGHGNGMLLVQHGTQRGDREWMSMAEWDGWVDASKAALVVSAPEGDTQPDYVAS